MGKGKSNKHKKHLADRVMAFRKIRSGLGKRGSRAARDDVAVGDKVNPFDVRYTREKHQVAGQRPTKRGRPGLARSKGMQKRKATLLVEYRNLTRSNKFVDRRFGEYNTDLTPEERMAERFAREKKSNYRTAGSSSLFNLAEPEDLTHYGELLDEGEMEKSGGFSDDEDDVGDEEKGKLSADYVARVHFGGGLLSKTDSKESKSHKEIVEEMISKTRQLRYESQREKAAQDDLTQRLDDTWKDVSKFVSKRDKDEMSTKADDFDKLVKELKFEARGTPTERLRTEEEIAKAEREKLEKLEYDRRLRMLGIVEQDERNKPTNSKMKKKKTVRFHPHLTGDDDVISDDDTNRRIPRSNTMIYYDEDGKMVMKKLGGDNDGNEEDDDEGEESEDDDEGEESEDEEGEENEDDDGDEGNEIAEGDEDEEEENEDSEDDEEDNMLDVVNASDEEDNEDNDEGNEDVNTNESSVKRKQVIKEAKAEVPYIFKLPNSYKDFISLISPYETIKHKILVLQRIYISNHPNIIGEEKVEKLKGLFPILIQYLISNELSADGGVEISDEGVKEDLFDEITKLLYRLAKHYPVYSLKAMETLLRSKLKWKCKKCPPLSTLLLLKLVSSLYVTSDEHHSATLPSLKYISHLMTKVELRSRRDAATLLYLLTLVLEYVTYAKRFVPESISSLYNLLIMFSSPNTANFWPPMKSAAPHSDLLRVTNDCSGFDPHPLHLMDELKEPVNIETVVPDNFKINMLMLCLKLLKSFSDLYSHLPSHTEIFKPVIPLLNELPINLLPSSIKDVVSDIVESFSINSRKPRTKLLTERPKPKLIKFLQPKLEENFDVTKKHKSFGGTGNKERNEHKRLEHKYKREMKATIREIKKDSQFLARQRLEEQLEKDADRREKVKRIYSLLSNQEGEVKKIKRQKLKIKF